MLTIDENDNGFATKTVNDFIRAESFEIYTCALMHT